MTRGTTPTHTFRLPIDSKLVKALRILYAQDDRLILEKTEKDCQAEGNTFAVRLTQEDTLAFDHRRPVQIQVRVLTVTGESAASLIYRQSVGQCLSGEVLT